MSISENVDLNLDDIDAEEPRKPDFAFVAGGQRFVLTNPADLDWKDLLEIDDPINFFRYCMPEEDKARFKALPHGAVTGKKLGQIIDAFQKHHGIGTQGNGRASRI